MHGRYGTLNIAKASASVCKSQEHGITVFGEYLRARAIPCLRARVRKASTLKENIDECPSERAMYIEH
ncbi:hypothetical protein M6B38_238865 [Iris pallida]|uniref:Uncharacterized protein n=1 Tax=Iris pallida TaxID=29817 RepID=A0AAX6DLJ2_IRIPA|nr:hypothetical protein M6B38_238865 [Iris pallida]